MTQVNVRETKKYTAHDTAVGAGRAKRSGACKGKGKGKSNKLVEANDRAGSAENLIVSFSCLTIKYGMVE